MSYLRQSSWVESIAKACDSSIVTNVVWRFRNTKHLITTLNNGYLGSHNDEERSEMRYVMRIA